jgi:glycosyltransferase involved in cell wall biosynthesis
LFIRERMFRVGAHLPVTVVSPQPWFPFQGLIRLWRPHFRPAQPRFEYQQGIPVHRPRYLSFPGIFKHWEGRLMALGVLPLVSRLRREPGFDLIDAHFAYPEGYAASLLGKWLNRGMTITLRGTEARMLQSPPLRRRILTALGRARRVFSVADALRQKAIQTGATGSGIQVVGNGVDTRKFYPVNQYQARKELGLPSQGRYLVSVGGLVERKGFHRVIEVLPQLLERFPDLHYLIVGGSSSEGSWEDRLRAQVQQLGLADQVHFLGVFPPERLYLPLSAADCFVLATSNEGWANVFLEAMACGLPVVTTDVGGNREVVCESGLGRLVPFGDRESLRKVLVESLEAEWDSTFIRAHAEANCWEVRVRVLVTAFTELVGSGPNPVRARAVPGERP